ncbi:hypothetical protein F7725_009695 [Dissostichus mawsoni]|uniref:Uncharacterized protein n=1 Tax=Dissostichus mawsoni TaxID=36200 RepID=A0A7J5XMU7_DISMA|nr:hypothetical protein F7725_009695 [Dissostichus mawsoni]
MKDATTLMSEESNPTVSLIAPINAQLFQDMTGTIGDSTMIHAIKNAIKTDLLKRYNSEAEKKILHTASALDPRFKGLPFLTVEERLEVYRGVTPEAASLENERTLRRTEVTEAPEECQIAKRSSGELNMEILTIEVALKQLSESQRGQDRQQGPFKIVSSLPLWDSM